MTLTRFGSFPACVSAAACARETETRAPETWASVGRANDALDKFDRVAELLANFAAQRIWNTVAATERWTLVKDLVDSVCIYPDRLTVQVAGAPPFNVALDEVGLKKGGVTVVSEGRRAQSPTGGSGPGGNANAMDPSRCSIRATKFHDQQFRVRIT